MARKRKSSFLSSAGGVPPITNGEDSVSSSSGSRNNNNSVHNTHKKGKRKGGNTFFNFQSVPIAYQTIQASGILLLSIITSLVYNSWYEEGGLGGNAAWTRALLGRIIGGDGSVVMDGRSIYYENSISVARDNRMKLFLEQVCNSRDSNNNSHYNDNDDVVYCHKSLLPKRSTQVAARNIRRDEEILKIPRSLQIWDLDAFIDTDFIQKYGTDDDDEILTNNQDTDTGADVDASRIGGIFNAKHKRTLNPLDTGAYLAVYLVYLKQQQQKLTESNPAENSKLSSTSSFLSNYLLDVLPTYEELVSIHDHPIFWNQTDLVQSFQNNIHSVSFNLINAYREMLHSEYDAFITATTAAGNSKQSINNQFKNDISLQDYYVARVAVLTRSFGTGPMQDQKSLLSDEELELYKQTKITTTAAAGTSANEKKTDEIIYSIQEDFENGFYSMVPILDFYNHHPHPNVKYSYNNEKKEFVITSIGKFGIQSGYEVYDNYGKYTDSHLFAKFGFINGDGSGHVQINLGINHRLLDWDLLRKSENKKSYSFLPFQYTINHSDDNDNDPNRKKDPLYSIFKSQKRDLLRYLQYDDGYKHCITNNNQNLQQNRQQQDNDNDESDNIEYEFKQLKLKHLLNIANDIKYWNIILQPRNPEVVPPRSITQISSTYKAPLKYSFYNNNLKFNANNIASTCKLITLRHTDYNGNAYQILKNNIHNASFNLFEQEVDGTLTSTTTPLASAHDEDSVSAILLEFRTSICIARLANEALSRFAINMNVVNNSTSSKDILDGLKHLNENMESKIESLNRKAYQSREFKVSHLLLGEIQGLEAIKSISFNTAKKIQNDNQDILKTHPNAFFIRDAPCKNKN